MLGISKGNGFPGRQTLLVLISSILERKNTLFKQCEAVQHKCKMHGVLVSELIVCAVNHSLGESIMCGTSVSVREKKDAFHISFTFAVSLWQCCGPPGTRHR